MAGVSCSSPVLAAAKKQLRSLMKKKLLPIPHESILAQSKTVPASRLRPRRLNASSQVIRSLKRYLALAHTWPLETSACFYLCPAGRYKPTPLSAMHSPLENTSLFHTSTARPYLPWMEGRHVSWTWYSSETLPTTRH